MNDKDFDKIFGDRLREERRFRENESDWQRLLAQLDAVRGVDIETSLGDYKGFRRWILPLVALLLLLTSGVLFGKLNDLDKANKAMTADMQTLKTPFVKIQDTIFVMKTDTVFIERQPVNQSANQRANSPFIKSKTNAFNEGDKHTQTKGVLNFNNTTLKRSRNTKLKLSNNPEFINSPPNVVQGITSNEQALKNKIAELENKLQTCENQQVAFSLNQIIASKDALIAQLLAKKTIDSAKVKAEFKEIPPLSINAQNTIKTAKKPVTSRLFVGINAGQIYYKSTWVSAANNVDIYKNVKSYQAGVRLEYALTDRLRLTAGGDYCPVDFKIFWQDPRYNLPIPQHFYPAVDKLKSTKATQKLTQGFVGTKYLFTGGSNRWRPYIGVAYTAMKILPFEAEFEVQNTATNLVRTLKASSTGINIANLLLINGGLEYRFNRRFVAQGEAFYNMDMNRPKKTYDLFGGRGAFLINF